MGTNGDYRVEQTSNLSRISGKEEHSRLRIFFCLDIRLDLQAGPGRTEAKWVKQKAEREEEEEEGKSPG